MKLQINSENPIRPTKSRAACGGVLRENPATDSVAVPKVNEANPGVLDPQRTKQSRPEKNNFQNFIYKSRERKVLRQAEHEFKRAENMKRIEERVATNIENIYRGKSDKLPFIPWIIKQYSEITKRFPRSDAIPQDVFVGCSRILGLCIKEGLRRMQTGFNLEKWMNKENADKYHAVLNIIFEMMDAEFPDIIEVCDDISDVHPDETILDLRPDLTEGSLGKAKVIPVVMNRGNPIPHLLTQAIIADPEYAFAYINKLFAAWKDTNAIDKFLLLGGDHALSLVVNKPKYEWYADVAFAICSRGTVSSLRSYPNNDIDDKIQKITIDQVGRAIRRIRSLMKDSTVMEILPDNKSWTSWLSPGLQTKHPLTGKIKNQI